MTPINKIKRGCGKQFSEDEICGCYIKWGTTPQLCPSCKALLTQTEEMLKEQTAKVEKLKEKFNGASAYSSWFINQEILKIFSQEADLQERK